MPDHPLWQLTLIDGLDSGLVGYYIKVHHAVLDGQAGVLLAQARKAGLGVVAMKVMAGGRGPEAAALPLLLLFGGTSRTSIERLRVLSLGAPVRSVQVLGPDGAGVEVYARKVGAAVRDAEIGQVTEPDRRRPGAVAAGQLQPVFCA